MSNKLTVCIINMATKDIDRARWVIDQLVEENAVLVDIDGNLLLMAENDSKRRPVLPFTGGSDIKISAKGIRDCDVCIMLSDNKISARVERKIDRIVGVNATPVHIIARGSTNRILIPIVDSDAIERYIDVCRLAGTHPSVYKNYYVEWERPCGFDFGSDHADSSSEEENAPIEDNDVPGTPTRGIPEILFEVINETMGEIPGPTKTNPPKVFISGTTNFAGELPFYWRAFLDLVMSAGSHILIGDAAGTDSCTQLYLSEMSYKDVEVCFSGENPCCNYGGWPSRHIWESDTGKEDGYWTSDMPKDMKMCELCDYGLFLWDGTDMSVAKNMGRLARMHKKCIVCTNDYGLDTNPLNLTDIMEQMDRLPVAAVYDANGNAHFQLAVRDFSKRYEIDKIGLSFIDGFKGLLREYSYGITE